jgi:prepilin-type N-terminal cleavage/methylation domain-containing protein
MKPRHSIASRWEQPALPQAAGSPSPFAPRLLGGVKRCGVCSTAVYAAFTLIELLAVIAIIGVIAMLVGPAVANIRKGDSMLAANRQMLGAVARARQLAMANHTTVYLVFVPTNYWLPPEPPNPMALTFERTTAATNLADKQLTGYNFISLRSAGDQPGQGIARYLGEWQTLPDSTFIPEWKFDPRMTNYLTNVIGPPNIIGQPVIDSPREVYEITGFTYTNILPFPMVEAATNPPNRVFAWLPYVAFNYLGQPLGQDNEPVSQDIFIPLAHGSVGYAIEMTTRRPKLDPPSVLEKPVGNSITNFNLIRVDRFTGRARLERQEIY